MLCKQFWHPLNSAFTLNDSRDFISCKRRAKKSWLISLQSTEGEENRGLINSRLDLMTDFLSISCPPFSYLCYFSLCSHLSFFFLIILKWSFSPFQFGPFGFVTSNQILTCTKHTNRLLFFHPRIWHNVPWLSWRWSVKQHETQQQQKESQTAKLTNIWRDATVLSKIKGTNCRCVWNYCVKWKSLTSHSFWLTYGIFPGKIKIVVASFCLLCLHVSASSLWLSIYLL